MFRRKSKPTQLNHLDELKPLIESGKPVLIDFFQFGCGPCKVMDGIVNELADDYSDSAHVVKCNVARVPGAAQAFGVRSTPTFVLLGGAPRKKPSKKRRSHGQPGTPRSRRVTPRWRGAGLIKKDFLEQVLESNGANRTS